MRFRQGVLYRSSFIIVSDFAHSNNGVLTRVTSTPLLPNILPHFETLANFVINTLPKPVLVALLYRLTILHLASRILPSIGANSWESEDDADDIWGDGPVRSNVFLYNILLIV